MQLIYCFVVGHGKSGGERAYIEDFNVYITDVVNHVKDLKATYSGIPIFLMGHSMVQDFASEPSIYYEESF